MVLVSGLLNYYSAPITIAITITSYIEIAYYYYYYFPIIITFIITVEPN